ncbi:hypothetical protein [Acetobacter sp.]|jgi:energy-coupling factor transporter ATP-binding protein EcfA2|uniref:hypothetical protein n=1 Tax=Acetobacter sp. TaxID=440 RepID=UPI0025BEFBDA|nr:hypothetical protein [Acetobacter sp.]MCH4091967.1 hypothetical protein [Acetobacter sp.]MCI1301113.1 hypothetical protein [Acetobacter sp.]MCI1317306.1 hypothetical protein [Acetobacter sp.]
MSTNGLIFTALEVENFRRFSGIHRLDGLGPGLNLLAASNESGKSTLLAALRALFLYKPGSSTKITRSFEPYSGGAPRILAEFILNGQAYRFEKQFLKKSFTRLTGPAGLKEGDDADAEVQTLLGLSATKKNETDGLLPALWVEQGQSFTQPELGDTARQSVQSCLNADFAEITGGADAARILKRVQDDLGRLVNGHNKRQGRYADAVTGEETATVRLTDLENRQNALDQDLKELVHARLQLGREQDPVRQQAEQAELEQARTRKSDLLRFGKREAEAKATVEATQRDWNRLRDERTLRADRRQRLADARQKVLEAEEEHRQAEARLQRAETALAERSDALGKLDERRMAAGGAVSRAEQALVCLQQQEQRDEAVRQQQHLESLITQVEKTLAAFTVFRVDEKRLRAIQVADKAVFEAETALGAQATGLEVTLEPGAADRVRLNGRVLEAGRLDLVDPAELKIEGVGTIRIVPAIRDRAVMQEAIDRARQVFRVALEAAGCADMAAAHADMERRRQAEAACRAAEEGLKAAMKAFQADTPERALAMLRQRIADAEAGLVQWREARGKDARGDEAAALPASVEDARAGLAAARRTLQEVEQDIVRTREALRDPLAEQEVARKLLEERRSDSRVLRDRQDNLQGEEDAAQAGEPDAVLNERFDRAGEALNTAERVLDRLNEERPAEPEALVDAAISRLEAQIAGRRERLARLQQEVATREVRIQAAEGAGLDEAIAACKRDIERHRTERESCEQEVAVLRLLKETLVEAERETTERYLAPLTRAIQPTIEMLFPRATASVQTDFTVSGLTRGRDEERVENLSDGTREQIAVLVRLGFADILHAQGRPAMLILDDALCFSDVVRTRTLFDILTDAASRMQIIVMTCREDQFAELSARPLRIVPDGAPVLPAV